MNKVFIYTNGTKVSDEIKSKLINKLNDQGFEITDSISQDLDLIFCIGGDGALLTLMQRHQFPTKPICGVNSGHLGFFQDFVPENIDAFLNAFKNGEYTTLAYNIVKATVITKTKTFEHRALNEFAVKSLVPHPLHLGISINNSFIENFSGDGICVASPAGSTGYNYSLGGSIVDPRLNLLQVTPISPMNSVAFRSLTSSILLPAKDKLIIVPDELSKNLVLQYDGQEIKYEEVEKIIFNISNRKINLVRLNESKFWEVVKDKFL